MSAEDSLSRIQLLLRDKQQRSSFQDTQFAQGDANGDGLLQRDELRAYLLRHGIDTKTTDMADCSKLKPFAGDAGSGTVPRERTSEAALLEICVYPVLSARQMRRIARTIRKWAGLPEASGRDTVASPPRSVTA